MRHSHHIGPRAENLAVQIALDEAIAAARLARLAVEIELHDVVGGDELRRQRARHQEPLSMAWMTHGNMARGVEYALIGQDAARGGKVFQHGTVNGATGRTQGL
jgi:hypothetical protein